MSSTKQVTTSTGEIKLQDKSKPITHNVLLLLILLEFHKLMKLPAYVYFGWVRFSVFCSSCGKKIRVSISSGWGHYLASTSLVNKSEMAALVDTAVIFRPYFFCRLLFGKFVQIADEAWNTDVWVCIQNMVQRQRTCENVHMSTRREVTMTAPPNKDRPRDRLLEAHRSHWRRNTPYRPPAGSWNSMQAEAGIRSTSLRRLTFRKDLPAILFCIKLRSSIAVSNVDGRQRSVSTFMSRFYCLFRQESDFTRSQAGAVRDWRFIDYPVRTPWGTEQFH